MKILITGASGFIGGYVVDEALARGHEVVALSRSQGQARSGQVWMVHDLADTKKPALGELGINAVVHLAAALTGSAEAQYRATVHATNQLISAMQQAGIRKLVGVSSMAVLDYAHVPPFFMIDETMATASGKGMGTYAQTKLAQEALFAEFFKQPRTYGSIVRPGLVYDEQRLIAAHAGVFAGFLGLLVAHAGEVPVVEVGALAKAIINATERNLSGGEVIHLIDDPLPRLPQYVAALRRRGMLPDKGFTVPWYAMSACAVSLRIALGAAGQQARMPEALQRHGFAARLKPFRYSSAKAKRMLSWTPGSHFG